MIVVGLDLSLTATGTCDSNGADVFKSKERGVRRLVDIRDHVLNLCLDRDGDVFVVMEGYSMGGQRGSAGVGQMLGELGGVIRVALHEAEVPWLEVPPSTLKKFATGKGNANKSAMGLAAARCGYDGPGDDNAIDAWWLRCIGRYGLGQPDVTVTEYRADALGKLAFRADAP